MIRNPKIGGEEPEIIKLCQQFSIFSISLLLHFHFLRSLDEKWQQLRIFFTKVCHDELHDHWK